MRWLIDFLFPKRLHRLGYVWRILTTNMVGGAIVATTSPMEHLSPMLGLVALCVYQLIFILLPRVRDTGMSGWWVLLGVVPIVYVCLTIILVFRAPEYHFGHASDKSTAKT
jgi:uncharacterized membrane protein YhaH (DUF805 family)